MGAAGRPSRTLLGGAALTAGLAAAVALMPAVASRWVGWARLGLGGTATSGAMVDGAWRLVAWSVGPPLAAALGAAVATNSDKLAPLWVLLGSSTVVSTLAVAFLAGVLGATLISLSGLRLATSNRLLSALNLLGMWRDLRKGGPDFFLYQAFLMAPGGLLTLGGILIGSANVFLIPLVWLLVLPVVCYTHLVQASLLGQYHRIYLRSDRPARSLLPRGCLIPLVLLGLLGTAGAAHADLSDILWNQQHQQHVYVPHVDTTVRHSR